MAHCHDEHGGHDHVHDHSDDVSPALQTLLYNFVDFDNLRTLNEGLVGAGAAIVKKTWAERLNPEPELASDADEQILMYIPFSTNVKLHALLLRTSHSPTAPRTLRLYLNRDDLDFSAAVDLQATQVLELSQTADVQEIPLRRALWNNTHGITLFFEDNFSGGEEEVTRLSYVGFKGESMLTGRAPVGFLYESASRRVDHQVGGVKDEGLGGSPRLGM